MLVSLGIIILADLKSKARIATVASADDYRGLYRDMLDHPSAVDMPLDERIELSVEIQSSQWRVKAGTPWGSDDLDDDVPF